MSFLLGCVPHQCGSDTCSSPAFAHLTQASTSRAGRPAASESEGVSGSDDDGDDSIEIVQPTHGANKKGKKVVAVSSSEEEEEADEEPVPQPPPRRRLGKAPAKIEEIEDEPPVPRKAGGKKKKAVIADSDDE